MGGWIRLAPELGSQRTCQREAGFHGRHWRPSGQPVCLCGLQMVAQYHRRGHLSPQELGISDRNAVTHYCGNTQAPPRRWQTARACVTIHIWYGFRAVVTIMTVGAVPSGCSSDRPSLYFLSSMSSVFAVTVWGSYFMGNLARQETTCVWL